MLYISDGQTCIVDGPDEHDRLARQGWQQTPMAIHQRPVVSNMPVLSGGDPMGMLLRSVLEAVLDERGLTGELVAKLAASLLHPSPEEGAPPFLPTRRRSTNG